MLNPQTTALLVIDVQGKLARSVQSSETMIDNIRRMIQGARILGVPVVWIEQYPQGLGTTVPEIAQLLGDYSALSKTTFSCCGSDQVMDELQRLARNQLLVCGIETHVCVYQSVAELLQRGYQVELISDAVSSRTAHNRELAMSKMASLGATLTSTEMALFELVGDSATDCFRDILPLVR
ncbi:hydrolase [Amphritea sp. HPY]|uniref:hydrolase n=1 Tax=Amphritea sp. HPY TaxID=3421652 RepID=UPI003D7EEA4C